MEEILAMLKGGHRKFWGSFNMGALSFNSTRAGAQKVCILKKSGDGGGGGGGGGWGGGGA